MRANVISCCVLASIVTSPLAGNVAGQKGWPTTATVVWSQHILHVTAVAGGQQSAAIAFRSNRPIQAVTLQVAGAAADFITVSPGSFSSVAADVSTNLSIQFSVPTGTANGIYKATVYVTAGTRTLIGELSVEVEVQSTSVSLLVDPTGGVVDLPQIATVSFPTGAFPSGAFVTLSRITSQTAQADFDVTAQIFGPGPTLPYQIKLDTGAAAPQTSFQLTATVPESFLGSLPATAEVRIFAQILEDGDEDLLDSFELIEGTFNAQAKTITVTLPANALTQERSGISHEAIIIVGTTPTKPLSPNPTVLVFTSPVTVPQTGEGLPRSSKRVRGIVGFPRGEIEHTLGASTACQASTIGPPLSGQLQVTSPFNPAGDAIRGRGHYGTDYRAAVGTQVMSVADGVVERIGFDLKTLPSGRASGWGRYVLVRHTDGSHSLYAHLITSSTDNMRAGDPVSRGQVLGQSDTTGGARGPHLHMEYAPSGVTFNNANKIDPDPCIGAINGSIVVRDNGNIADDAFKVIFNNVVLGQTQIGGSSNFAVNNLRPGTYNLTITAVIAPDDVGTYEITLSNQLTFVGGGTARSGTLPMNGSATFGVVVPN